MLRYIITFFWSFLLGQVVCYIGAALKGAPDDMMMATVISLILGLVVTIIGTFAPNKESHDGNAKA